MNKVGSFSSKFKLYYKVYIYWFQSNLKPDNTNYFDFYTKEYDPFNDERNIMYDLS